MQSKLHGESLNQLIVTVKIPLYWGGQGSKLTATSWGKLVSRALDLHGRLGKGSKYSNPEGLIEAIIKMLSFVDDNNISNNGESWEIVAQVLQKTQHDAQLWNDILQAMGGSLNLKKYFYQVISYIYAKVGAPVVTPTEKN